MDVAQQEGSSAHFHGDLGNSQEGMDFNDNNDNSCSDSCLFSATGNTPKKATSQNGSHTTELTV